MSGVKQGSGKWFGPKLKGKYNIYCQKCGAENSDDVQLCKSCSWVLAGTAVLYGLIIFGGFLLFIVPGIIWSVKFSLWSYFVVDKGLGPVQALKASSRATMGVKWDLFGFGIVCGAINILGVLCLIIGIFATYPTVIVATALVYRQLAAQTPELDEFGIGTYAVEPGTESIWGNGVK